MQDGRNLTVRNWTLLFFYVVTAAGIVGLARSQVRSRTIRSLGRDVLTLVMPQCPSRCRGFGRVRRLAWRSAGVTLAWLTDRAAPVDERRPRVRPLNAARSALVLGVLAVIALASLPVWRDRTRPRARHAVEAAAMRDESGLAGLLAAYDTTKSTQRPPQLDQADLDAVHDLLGVLGARAPQTDGVLHSRVVDALRGRTVSHEADVIGLLSAGEEIAASREHRPASLAAIRERYERDVRRNDATLEPWDDVTAGAAVLRAQHAIDALRGGRLSAARQG
jgi:hypothetical protein